MEPPRLEPPPRAAGLAMRAQPETGGPAGGQRLEAESAIAAHAPTRPVESGWSISPVHTGGPGPSQHLPARRACRRPLGSPRRIRRQGLGGLEAGGKQPARPPEARCPQSRLRRHQRFDSRAGSLEADISAVAVGGIRVGLPRGRITEGSICGGDQSGISTTTAVLLGPVGAVRPTSALRRPEHRTRTGRGHHGSQQRRPSGRGPKPCSNPPHPVHYPHGLGRRWSRMVESPATRWSETCDQGKR